MMVFFVTWYWMMSVKCEDNKTNFMVSEKEDRATVTFLFANCWYGWSEWPGCLECWGSQGGQDD